VMTENYLDVRILPERKVAQLMSSSKPIDLWITYFLSLVAPQQEGEVMWGVQMLGSSSTGLEWEEVGIPPSLEDFEWARAMLWTPKRLKVGPLLASLVDTSPAGGVDLATLEDLEEFLDGVAEEEKEAFMRTHWGKL
jgi:hypothetical protein